MFIFTAVGNLTKDAELFTPATGDRVCINFSIAINQRLRDSDDKVTFLNVAYWVKSNGLLNYLKKGTKVAVSGDWYQNSKTANGTYYQTFHARALDLLGNASNTLNNGNNDRHQNIDNRYSQEEQDDLPF